MLLWMSLLSHQYVCTAMQKAFKPFREKHIWQATHLPQGRLVLQTSAYRHSGAHTEKSSLLLPSLQCLLLVSFSWLSARIFSPSFPPPPSPSAILSLSVTSRATHLLQWQVITLLTAHGDESGRSGNQSDHFPCLVHTETHHKHLLALIMAAMGFMTSKLDITSGPCCLYCCFAHTCTITHTLGAFHSLPSEKERLVHTWMTEHPLRKKDIGLHMHISSQCFSLTRACVHLCVRGMPTKMFCIFSETRIWSVK